MDDGDWHLALKDLQGDGGSFEVFTPGVFFWKSIEVVLFF